jgi:hypothetical protein
LPRHGGRARTRRRVGSITERKKLLK